MAFGSQQTAIAGTKGVSFEPSIKNAKTRIVQDDGHQGDAGVKKKFTEKMTMKTSWKTDSEMMAPGANNSQKTVSQSNTFKHPSSTKEEIGGAKQLLMGIIGVPSVSNTNPHGTNAPMMSIPASQDAPVTLGNPAQNSGGAFAQTFNVPLLPLAQSANSNSQAVQQKTLEQQDTPRIDVKKDI